MNDSTTTKAYDALGNVALITKPEGIKRQMEYDTFGRLIKVTDDPAGLNLVTRYEYDANNNQTHQYDVKGHEVEFTYDSLNRKIQHIQHRNSGGDIVTRFTKYDAEGNLQEMTDPNGNVISYVYDELNRQTEANYPNLNRSFNNIVKIGTEYDANNNVIKVTETKQGQSGTVNDVTVNQYDNFDRLIKVENIRGSLIPSPSTLTTIDYSYDLNGNKIRVSTSSTTAGTKITSYTYNNRNRLVTANFMSEGSSQTTSYAYLRDGRKDTVTYPNGTIIKYTYYATNRIESITNKKSNGAIISQYAYVYDRNGNRKSQVEVQGGVTGNTSYTYDRVDRLTEFTLVENSGTTVTAYTFEGYDRKTEQVTENGVAVKNRIYTYDELNRLTEILDNTSAVSLFTIHYEYDANGNTLTKTNSSALNDIETFTYDSRNQLIEVKHGPPGSEESLGKYDYNAEGLRIRHRNSERGDVDYFYDDNAVIEEHKAGDGSLLAHYRYADRLISLETSTSTQFYHHDALGSTVDLTDKTGAVIVAYWLDPWGHIRKQEGESVNRQVFTGQEHDEKTGLIYFGSRYYDPDTARFITQDVYLGEENTPPSLNRYLYAYSNPTVYVDLEGYAISTTDDLIRDQQPDSESRYVRNYQEYQQIEARADREEAMHDSTRYLPQNSGITVEDRTGNQKIKLSEINVSEKGKVFIWNQEVYKDISNRLHWPKGKSGVTLGSGYDMRDRKKEDVKKTMIGIGLSEGTAELISEGSGLTKDDAKKFAEKNMEKFQLTPEQEWALMEKVMPGYVQIVKSALKGAKIEDISQDQFDALVSFTYNVGSLPKKITEFLASDKMNEVTEKMKEYIKSGKDVSPTLVRRRQQESDMLLHGNYGYEPKYLPENKRGILEAAPSAPVRPRAPVSKPRAPVPRLPVPRSPTRIPDWYPVPWKIPFGG